MTVAPTARSVGAANDVGVVVVGCGYWGRNYVRVLDEVAGARVIAVCDTSPGRLAAIGEHFPGVHLSTRLEEALALPGVHAAVISTPASTHFPVARRCLLRGAHVLVEKPVTTRSRDAEALVRLAEEVGATLMCGHTFVYNAGIRMLKTYLDRGDFGRVYYLYARRTSLGPIRTDVNALWDLAPHDIAIFDFLLDARPARVSAIGSSLLCDDREDVGFITLTYPNGIIAHVHVSWADPNKTREVVVVGSDRRLVFNDLNPLERVRVFEKGVTRVLPDTPTYGETTFLLRDGDIISPVVEASEPLKNECQHFLDCVRTGERPLTDGHAGRDVVLAMEAIERSLRRHGHPAEADVRRAAAIPARRLERDGATHTASLS
jgi:predicted dehydrogenase